MELKRVNRVQFGVMSPDFMVRQTIVALPTKSGAISASSVVSAVLLRHACYSFARHTVGMVS
jgi:hypothetical protein